VEFDPTTAGAATGQLTINSTSSTNGTAVIALNGTGTAAALAVDLSWDAPGSSEVPIAGYNIYRATSGTSTFQLLNSSVDANTAYVDTTAQSGVSYDYYVESVSTSGMESVPSNIFSVTVN
jgi:fibronectin type 3 domain-containing protein